VHDLSALVWLKLKTLDIAQWGSVFCLLIEIGDNNARAMLSSRIYLGMQQVMGLQHGLWELSNATRDALSSKGMVNSIF